MAALALVIGGLFGIYQCLEHKSAVRIDCTMAFVERYHGNSKLVKARLKINGSIAKRTAQLNKILSNLTLKPEDLQIMYDSKILKLVNGDALNGALEQLFTFYEQIILC